MCCDSSFCFFVCVVPSLYCPFGKTVDYLWRLFSGLMIDKLSALLFTPGVLDPNLMFLYSGPTPSVLVFWITPKFSCVLDQPQVFLYCRFSCILDQPQMFLFSGSAPGFLVFWISPKCSCFLDQPQVFLYSGSAPNVLAFWISPKFSYILDRPQVFLYSGPALKCSRILDQPLSFLVFWTSP